MCLREVYTKGLTDQARKAIFTPTSMPVQRWDLLDTHTPFGFLSLFWLASLYGIKVNRFEKKTNQDRRKWESRKLGENDSESLRKKCKRKYGQN